MNLVRHALLLDECCDAALVARLRAEGFDVAYVQEIHPGLSDRDVLALAKRDNRLLVTEDKDFGELAVQRGAASMGVVLIRMKPAQRNLKADRMIKLLSEYSDRLSASYTVVQSDKFRFRRLS